MEYQYKSSILTTAKYYGFVDATNRQHIQRCLTSIRNNLIYDNMLDVGKPYGKPLDEYNKKPAIAHGF
jgi:hypothetical protein